MSAAPGDRVVVHSTKVGGHTRDGEVVAARGEDGGPPYVVRWSDTGVESLLFPGPDTVIHHGGTEHATTQD
ncbi:DUF1918 domain-containing protein [Georgenia sp. H159]|uniref:DUF1918 domain-containing protein n=1 Tax=Georgenia sp. H159 TaxID=3076115 RepID=UPI002D78D365|nr:DUF1918 domain-containing protein [Georgenia sp. H159]